MFWTSVIAVASLLLVAAQKVIPPETPLVSFHWTLTAGRLRNTIAACTPLRFQLQAGLDSTKEIFPPFLLSILPEGAQPVTKWIENIGVHESFWTTIDLPPGTNFSLALQDSKTHFGGLVGGYTAVTSPSTSCEVVSSISSKLGYTVSFDVVNELGFAISGGTPPFTISILNLGAGNWANATCRTRNLRVAQQVPRGSAYSIFVSDSNNVNSIISSLYISNFTPAAQYSSLMSKSTTGVIIGATIGGITLVVVSGIALLLHRRRRRRAEEEERKIRSPLSSTRAKNGGNDKFDASLENNESAELPPLSSGSGHFFGTPDALAYIGYPPAPVLPTPSPPSSPATKRIQLRPAQIIIPQRPHFSQSPSPSFTRSQHRRSLTPTYEEESSTSAGCCTCPNSPSRLQRRASLITVGGVTSRRGSVVTVGEGEPLADPSEFHFRL